MSPHPKIDDDLFIEPPSDDDIIYGDYNNTMDGSSSSPTRPYLRLTTSLRNTTKNSGQDIRLRCDALGTPPITFQWEKNHAPVEVSKRIKIRNRDTTTRLIITNAHVLDSAFYQCIATNSAGSVNSSAILKIKHGERVKSSRPSSSSPIQLNNEEDYDDYDDMDHSRGRLPSEEDSDLYSVPDSAGGEGFMSIGTSERWLDQSKIREGECVLYRGEACRSFLSGRYIRIISKNREDMYDVDRNLRAAVMFINNFDRAKPECKRISHAVACFHMYKVCDPIDDSRTQTICKDDCNKLTTSMCPSEMSEASAHELIGDGPRALFPTCSTLSHTNSCIPILSTRSTIPSSSSSSIPRSDHWCYIDSGRTYNGVQSMTQSGKKCQLWNDVHNTREFNPQKYPELRYAANYCRNPGGGRPRPWCYSSPMGQEEYCDVPQCPPHFKSFDINNNEIGSGSSSSDVSSLWLGLGTSVQLGIIGGLALLSIITLFLICVCCCRRKGGDDTRKNGRSHITNTLPTNSIPNIHSAPQSIINNTGQYRKANGTSTPLTYRVGGVEMSSLLSGERRGDGLYEDSNHPFHVLEISSNHINGLRQIGTGHFGHDLHIGIWNGSPTGDMQVILKSASSDPTIRATLEEEIRRVARISHPNIMCMVGVSYLDGGHIMGAVYEYSINGSLLSLCRLRAVSEERERDTHAHDFLSFALQISSGMEYLSVQGIVHQDLAARNIFIGEGMQAKIGDIANMLSEYQDDYVKFGARSYVPIRWMAKEAIETGRLSEKSDVWSYGVTLWEMYSYGRIPYEGYSNNQVSQLLNTRQLLEAPQHCPTNMYSLMVECWHEMVDRRPSFMELHRRLQTWQSISPPHSLIHNTTRGTSSSSHSSSSRGGGPIHSRNRSNNQSNHRMNQLRRPDDSSPLMSMREPQYEYTDEDADSD